MGRHRRTASVSVMQSWNTLGMIQWLREQVQQVEDIGLIFRTFIRRMRSSSNVPRGGTTWRKNWSVRVRETLIILQKRPR